MSLLPSPEVLLAVLVGSFVLGLSINSISRLTKICLAVIAVHFVIVILLPYLFLRRNTSFPGVIAEAVIHLEDLALAGIVGYVSFSVAAFAGHGVRVAISRLFFGRPT